MGIVDMDYQRFLTTSDPVVWERCLAAYDERLAEAQRVNSERVVEALCIAIFFQWLSRVGGDREGEQRGKDAYHRFEQRAREIPLDRAARAWGVILGWTGYVERAKALLDGERGPEVALLTLPRDHAERASALRPFVVGRSGTPFPPALLFYCNALIDLGAIGEVEKLIAKSELDETDPILCDLKGKLHERAGEWSGAYEAYKESGWPTHRYRAALSKTIAEGGRSLASAGHALTIDTTLQSELLSFSPEIDQVELARCAAFIEACSWHTYEDWFVSFELGKLNFRRRRYAEADAHFRAAFDAVPDECRFAVARFRFDNLTWTWHRSSSADLPMRPETLECARAAIDAADRPEHAAGVRLWFAEWAKDLSMLPEDVGSWSVDEQARAHRLVGNTELALDAEFRSLAEAYNHRNVFALQRVFSHLGFETCVVHTVDLMLRESEGDFFALWELGNELLGAREAFMEGSETFRCLSERLSLIARQLLDLSVVEFQNVVRAHELFCQTNRQDIAEALLLRGAALADGPAENLTIAIARRRTAWSSAAHGDRVGLECLLRAERESTSRLERLQIARELFFYGHRRRALEILNEERAFEDCAGFDPIDFVVALQMRPAFSPSEREVVVKQALRSLDLAIEAGKIRWYAHEFFERLAGVAGLDPPIARSTGPEDDCRLQPTDTALRWRQIDEAISAGDFDLEMSRFNEAVVELGDGSSLARRLAFWSWTNAQLVKALAAARKARPVVHKSRIPICENPALDSDRARELCRLWQSHLDSPTERTHSLLERFYKTEAQLMSQWKAHRRRAAKKHNQRALFYSEFALGFLPTLVTRSELEEPHPLLRDLYACIATDSEHALARVEKKVESLRKELA